MNRRSFLSTTVGAGIAAAAQSASAQSNSAKFKLRYGPHAGMFRNSAGENIIDQIKFSADQGFTGWEDNGAMSRTPELQSAIGKALDQAGMKMGVFVSVADFKTTDYVTKTDKEFRTQIQGLMRNALETAKRTGAKWHTVVPGLVNPRIDPWYQFANCVTNLKAMCEVLEPAGSVIVRSTS